MIGLLILVFSISLILSLFPSSLYFQIVFSSVNKVSSSSSSYGSSNASKNNTDVKPNNYVIKVGEGNSSISFTKYFPSYVEINTGDSITWYNGMDIPNPHTVTFVRDLDNQEKVAEPFYIKNSTQFAPILDNLGDPLEEVTKNGTKIIMALNSRAFTPTVITSQEKVVNFGKDTVYIFKGDEKFVNSGPLLSIDKKQTFDYFFSNSFTLIFTKPGLYEYHCLFHPWMIGKILVKPT